MSLNKSKGNMYDFITHTWNTIKGECFHDCSYCYMKRWGKLKPARFDEKELKTDLGNGNFIFVGSSNDMFAENVNKEWVMNTLSHCARNTQNKYFFQTKNPNNFWTYFDYFPANSSFCITLESNRNYKEIMQNSPSVEDRVMLFENLPVSYRNGNKYVTVEPIMDFDLDDFVKMLRQTEAKQINIGADSGGNSLPEPSKEKISALISELEKFTIVKQKSNLKRLLK